MLSPGNNARSNPRSWQLCEISFKLSLMRLIAGFKCSNGDFETLDLSKPKSADSIFLPPVLMTKRNLRVAEKAENWLERFQMRCDRRQSEEGLDFKFHQSRSLSRADIRTVTRHWRWVPFQRVNHQHDLPNDRSRCHLRGRAHQNRSSQMGSTLVFIWSKCPCITVSWSSVLFKFVPPAGRSAQTRVNLSETFSFFRLWSQSTAGYCLPSCNCSLIWSFMNYQWAQTEHCSKNKHICVKKKVDI